MYSAVKSFGKPYARKNIETINNEISQEFWNAMNNATFFRFIVLLVNYFDQLTQWGSSQWLADSQKAVLGLKVLNEQKIREPHFKYVSLR